MHSISNRKISRIHLSISVFNQSWMHRLWAPLASSRINIIVNTINSQHRNDCRSDNSFTQVSYWNEILVTKHILYVINYIEKWNTSENLIWLFINIYLNIRDREIVNWCNNFKWKIVVANMSQMKQIACKYIREISEREIQI